MKGYTIIIGQYLDELKSDDSKKRLNSVEHLLDIAKCLGPQRTKDELLPFLKELLDDEEETLIALAKSLYDLTTFVGGGNISQTVFPSYESLFSNEDASVRLAALECTEKLVAEYGYKDEELYNMAKRLGSSDNYASRISAIMLFCRLATCFPSNKHKDIMSLLSTSTSSEIPAVRKTVAIYIKDLLKQVPKMENEGLNI